MTSYTKCTVRVLRTQHKDLDLPFSGTKQDLIDRLATAKQSPTLTDQSAVSTVIPETTNNDKRKMMEEDVQARF